MIDLNHTHDISDRINFLIDTEIDKAVEVRRDYVGGSIIGHECERYIQHSYLVAIGLIPSTSSFPARTKRIFQRGNIYEAEARTYLQRSGFDFCPNESKFSDFDGRFRGHFDGVITDGPDVGLKYPCLWECKCLKDKNWKALNKDGLKKYSSTYWTQIHVYMDYGELTNCLYTVVNADTMEILHRRYDRQPEVADFAKDRMQRVINSSRMFELVPRCTNDKNYLTCKWCDCSEWCWSH